MNPELYLADLEAKPAALAALASALETGAPVRRDPGRHPAGGLPRHGQLPIRRPGGRAAPAGGGRRRRGRVRLGHRVLPGDSGHPGRRDLRHRRQQGDPRRGRPLPLPVLRARPDQQARLHDHRGRRPGGPHGRGRGARRRVLPDLPAHRSACSWPCRTTSPPPRPACSTAPSPCRARPCPGIRARVNVPRLDVPGLLRRTAEATADLLDRRGEWLRAGDEPARRARTASTRSPPPNACPPPSSPP